MPITGTIYSKQITATTDLPFQVDDNPKTVLTSINIHCYTNDMYYGNAAFQIGLIRPNSVVWFDGKIRVSDLWFKNFASTFNGVIAITGILEEG